MLCPIMSCCIIFKRFISEGKENETDFTCASSSPANMQEST